MRSVSVQMSCVSARSSSFEAGLQQLRGAADARERVLDLVGEHRRHARHGARGGAVRELALDHLRHRALLQHQHDQARLVGHARRANTSTSRCTPLRGRPTSTPYSLTVAPGAPHLPDQRAERAREGDDVGQRLALEHAVAEREERLRRRVGVEHAVVVAEHQDRMRQRGEQQIVLDVPALAATPARSRAASGSCGHLLGLRA